MSGRYDDWVRHYENQLWAVIAAFLAASIALLFLSNYYYEYGYLDAPSTVPIAEILGLAITWLTIYFAAGVRELRHRAMEHLDDESKLLFRSPRLPQWWAFVALHVLVAAVWTWRMIEYANVGLSTVWYTLGLLSVCGVAVVGFLYRKPRQAAHD